MKWKREGFVNNECISFGITFNWNMSYSIEIDFWKWTVECIFAERRKKNAR
jgi:hypothetical protein